MKKRIYFNYTIIHDYLTYIIPQRRPQGELYRIIVNKYSEG